MSSSRYTVAIHILTLLAWMKDEALTSEFIAGSVNTNPVVIRRILALLREAKFVSSRSGPGGGWSLARPAESITLRDVYWAIEEGAFFSMHTNEPNPKCPVGRDIQEILRGHFSDARQALAQQLAKTTISDLIQSIDA